MAWTTPRTWTDGELVTASLMNAHLRDNFNTVPHLSAYKSADQSVTSSTALVDCTSMSHAVGANQVWWMQWTIIYTASTAGDIKFAFTFPAGATSSLGIPVGLGSDALTPANQSFTTSGTSAGALGGLGTPRIVYQVVGAMETAGTAGTVQLQFAQQTSDGTASIVRKSSSLFVYQLA